VSRRAHHALAAALPALVSWGCGDDAVPGGHAGASAGTGGDATAGAGVGGGDPTGRPKALVVGIDGLRHDFLATSAAPNLQAFAELGISARTWLYAPPLAATLSGPGWATNATGVWPDKHRVTSNDFPDADLEIYPDFLTRLEAARPELRSFTATDWAPLALEVSGGPIFGDAIDEQLAFDADTDGAGYAFDDIQIAEQAAATLRDGDPDVSFVYLGNVDVLGHVFGAASAEYREGIATADAQLGALLAAVAARPTRADEDWLLVVTTDHGMLDIGGHGGITWEERQAFLGVIADGRPATALAIAPRNVDLAPTILEHFGVAVDPAWSLDGIPIGIPSEDPFDDLVGALEPAVDEAHPGPGFDGWTRTPPEGWDVDDGAMPAGGTTEWRGWSFTTDAFWTAADRGQGRENFVRARGVFAVADADEWDDTGTPSLAGSFDSTLVSAPYPVDGATSVRLQFASHYRQSGAQKAEVSVAFDGAAPAVVLRYGPAASDANAGGDVPSRIESLLVPVPAGATAMVVRWRYFDAGNDWFWAVDAPLVEVAR
jgi:hypothetical protein